jgi:PBP1b-binding outer membrane lipoprotein LpoB
MRVMRTVVAILVAAFIVVGCSNWTVEDTVNAGGKLLYDTFKAKQEADKHGY